MSAGQSQRSVASSTRRRQEAELAAAEERERAAAETAAAAARASRLAAAELAAARAEAEAAAAANAARAAAAEVEALRGSIGSSISADDTADADLELLEREAARARAAQWAAAHAHERGGSLDRRGRAGGAPGGGAHGNGGGRVDGERGLHRQRGSLSPDRYHGYHGLQAVVRDVGPGGGWPTLTKTNYVEWAAVMRVKLQVRHMWEAIRYGDVDYDQDRRALDALIAAVPSEMQFSLTNKRTAKEA